jgi:hypothetical protein
MLIIPFQWTLAMSRGINSKWARLSTENNAKDEQTRLNIHQH